MHLGSKLKCADYSRTKMWHCENAFTILKGISNDKLM